MSEALDYKNRFFEKVLDNGRFLGDEIGGVMEYWSAGVMTIIISLLH
jgi:hypothetical protein